MGSSTLQTTLQSNTLDAVTSTNTNASQQTTPREQIAALAKQFHLTTGVARSLYRGIIKKDPKATGASLLGQFAQAVSKRTLSQTRQANQKGAVSVDRDSDAITQKASTNQFFSAEPAANASGLSQQEYKQVTQNPQAGPVLPPPKQPPAGSTSITLEQTLGRSKVPHLDPNHPNWAAFYVLLRDSWDAHTIDRMIQTQYDAAVLQKVQGMSLETNALLVQGNVQKERNAAVFNAVGSMLGIPDSIRGDAAKKLVNVNSVEDAKDLDIVNAGEKAQHQAPFRDLLREDAISAMAGAREPGAGARFMDADAKHAQADRMELSGGKGTEAKTKSLVKQYRAPTDDETTRMREGRRQTVDALTHNAPLTNIDLDKTILTQAIPGKPTEAQLNGQGASPTHISRRFLTKAEISGLSPTEQKHYQSMLEAFYGARMSDLTDRVQAVEQEVGRLSSAARTARSEAAEPTRMPPGTSAADYRSNCNLMANALDKKAKDLKSELVDSSEVAKQVLQRLAFTNRTSMRQVMQHAGWLENLAEKVRDKTDSMRVILQDPNHDESLDAKQRLQVMEETAYAINRRLFDLYQSVIPYRGDDHQVKGRPLQRNERLDQFKSAPGAKEYNKQWDDYEALQAKGGSRSKEENDEMGNLQTSLKFMHKAAPAQVWEAWKLERLKVKADHLRSGPNADPQAADAAEQTLHQAIATATTRVDSKWMAFVMDSHNKERHAHLLKESHQKVLDETDPSKKATLIQEHESLQPQLEAREAFWKEQFERSKANTIKHKAQSVATNLGFGPSITYRVGGGLPATSLPSRGRNAGIVGNQAGTQKGAEILRNRIENQGPNPNAAEGQAIRNDVDQAHHAAYKRAQNDFENQDNAAIRDNDDGWMGQTGRPDQFEHVDPGVDYNDPVTLNKRLTEANKAMGASLANWDDRGQDKAKPVRDAIQGLGQTFQSADNMQGVAENLAQETADTAAGLVQEIQGDFAAMYDQIMAMRSRLMPLIAKVSPWG